MARPGRELPGIQSFTAAYKETVHWKPNFSKYRVIFEAFIFREFRENINLERQLMWEEAWFSISIREITFREQELNWLFAKYIRLENNPLYGTTLARPLSQKWLDCIETGSALESIAMAAVIILPPLLLQKPARSSKNKDHIRCIERRFPLWRNGQIDELLAEGRTLQNRLSKLPTHRNYVTKDPDARRFANEMFHVKVKQALNLLTTNTSGGPVHLEDKVTGQDGEQSVEGYFT